MYNAGRQLMNRLVAPPEVRALVCGRNNEGGKGDGGVVPEGAGGLSSGDMGPSVASAAPVVDIDGPSAVPMPPPTAGSAGAPIGRPPIGGGHKGPSGKGKKGGPSTGKGGGKRRRLTALQELLLPYTESTPVPRESSTNAEATNAEATNAEATLPLDSGVAALTSPAPISATHPISMPAPPSAAFPAEAAPSLPPLPTVGAFQALVQVGVGK